MSEYTNEKTPGVSEFTNEKTPTLGEHRGSVQEFQQMVG
jgi:hypothetical protein